MAPRSPPPIPQCCPSPENPAFPGGVFFLGGAELTDQARLEEGDALRECVASLHSFQNNE